MKFELRNNECVLRMNIKRVGVISRAETLSHQDPLHTRLRKGFCFFLSHAEKLDPILFFLLLEMHTFI